jgi:hypothetical protein
MGKRLLTAFVTMISCGCQSGTGEPMIDDGADISNAAASAIAGDMTTGLVEQIGPAGTKAIRLRGDGSHYATALKAALKGWGYRVVADGDTKDMPKDQELIELDHAIVGINGQALARLSTPTRALGRVYTVTATGAVPSSPLSVRQP